MQTSSDLRRLFDRRARGGEARNVLEKDYALSYILAGIARVPELYEIALFKGGTSLRKAYFENYRFSVDLDYTLLRRVACGELKGLIDTAVQGASELLKERGAFELQMREVPHRDEHERGQCEFKIDVRYPWMGQASALKIELLPSPPEVVVGKPVERRLLHVGFDETLDATMRCYELREIIAEKLRGLLQSRQRYDELDAGKRSFARSRPRDLFDLAYLHRQTIYSIDRPSVHGFLVPKAEAYGVSFKGPDDFLDVRVLDAMKRDWEGQLGDFIAPLPTFDECLAVHRELVAQIFS